MVFQYQFKLYLPRFDIVGVLEKGWFTNNVPKDLEPAGDFLDGNFRVGVQNCNQYLVSTLCRPQVVKAEDPAAVV